MRILAASGARSASGTSSVLAWVANAAAQLGDGKTGQGGDLSLKVTLPARTWAAALAAGGHHSLAVTWTGQVLAWGFNGDGELDDGERHPQRCAGEGEVARRDQDHRGGRRGRP